LLPSLVVYAALSTGLVSVALLSVCGGLCFDSLSANPWHYCATFILNWVHYSAVSRINPAGNKPSPSVLGLAAGAAAPLLTMLLLLNAEKQPLLVGFRSTNGW